MKKPIRIMLIEDHAGYRETIKIALTREETMALTSEFGTAEIALRALQNPDAEQLPTVILLDLNLPGMSGLEALPWIREYAPDSEVIVLTQSDHAPDVHQAITRGASGYLLKSATLKEITEGIQTVVSGGASLHPDVARYLLNTVRAQSPQVEVSGSLSDRELEILRLLGDGMIKKEIAEHLQIGITTVAYHVKHIYEKLEVPNAPAAIQKAYQSGIFPSDRA